MDREIKEKIKYLLYPRSVAVIGASRNPRKIGFQVVYNLIKDGYKGRIYPINPNADEILGLKCYPNILDAPDDIDLAMIVVPASKVLNVLNEVVRKKV
ncbi:TPA: acyl-CoA synthetase (NDP forming), partial [Candidatus Geothermarchaeota archaeon]|nr:acyl-CoA synthetase (NDP forming) [Candidatus Geothermarchaeota archaeon]